jgi:hypothetical protein
MSRRPVPLAILAALALVALAAAAPARADFAPQGIEIDGNYLDDPPPAEDWFPGFPPMRDPFGSDDDTLCGTSPAPKNDITNFFLANNQDFLFLGMERLANTGQTSFFFFFDITNDGPSKGDFIFVFCFGSGTNVTDTFVLEFDPATGEFVRDSTPPAIEFAVNTARIPAPFKAYDRHGKLQPFIDAGKFAEASVDLSSIEGFDICAASAVKAEVQTKSSCSLSSECKDTSGPFLFSFEVLEADLALEQASACDPVITATANAQGPKSPLAYKWFLDGVELMGPGFGDQDKVQIPVPADQCGPHEVKVEVTDGTCTVVDSDTIDINVPPAAGFAQVAVGACDLTLAYDGGASTDCDGDPLTFAWDLDGDGLTDSTSASGTFLYPSCGERKVSLVVNDGKCDSPAIEVAVYANQPPVAGIAITPVDCLTVDYLDTSVDCDLGQVSSLYTEKLAREVDFGDGSPKVTGPSGSHTYGTCGTYTVTITETDAMGCASNQTRQVTFTMSVTVN